MAYVSPPKADFIAIFTDFADVSDTLYDYWLARAERVIDTDYGDDQLHATMLLTAHYLATQGQGSGTDAQIAGFAGANKVKSGDLELGWANGANGSGGGPTGFDATRYGREVKGLAIRYKGGPRVACTGSVPIDPSRYPQGQA